MKVFESKGRGETCFHCSRKIGKGERFGVANKAFWCVDCIVRRFNELVGNDID